MTLLEIDGLRIERRSGGVVVDGVGMRVSEGRSRGLVGESGSGKTVTLRAVLGLLPRGLRLTEGSIRYQGVELTGLPERALRRYRGSEIGYVGQDPALALDPLMTVGGQIREALVAGGSPARAARSAAVDWLDRVGIREPDRAAGRHPFELSGGQRQRVCIAMALAGHPKLVLCDEPTTALDVTVQRTILDLLRALVRDEGVSLLFVTHDLPVAASITEDLTVLRNGVVIEEGETASVVAAPTAAYTRELIAASPRPPGRATANGGA